MHNKTVSFKYALLLLLVVIALVIVLIRTRPAPQAVLQEPPVLRVETAVVRRLDLQPRTEVTGYLRPARKSTLHFEVGGRVSERLVEAGQTVTAGQPLLRLEDGDYRDAVAAAEARLEQERAAIERDRRLLAFVQRNRELQAREVERLQQLGAESLASPAKRDEALQRLLQLQAEEEKLRFSVATAAARLQLQEADLRRARRGLARTRLAAPYAGMINAVFLEVGDHVDPASPAVELVDLEQLDLYLEVNGTVAAALRMAQRVTVRPLQGEPREGVVIALQRDPDPRTFSHAVRVRLPGMGLMPGQAARALLPLPPLPDALVVPVSAVWYGERGDFVFKVEAGRLQRVAVELGPRHDPWQVVRKGLDAGDIVVSRDVALLSDGQPVRPLPAASGEGPGRDAPAAAADGGAMAAGVR